MQSLVQQCLLSIAVDSGRHLDLTGQAWGQVQAGLSAMITHEEAADLFDEAWKTFQEVSAIGEAQQHDTSLVMGQQFLYCCYPVS